jgi:hypothetical protein
MTPGATVYLPWLLGLKQQIGLFFYMPLHRRRSQGKPRHKVSFTSAPWVGQQQIGLFSSTQGTKVSHDAKSHLHWEKCNSLGDCSNNSIVFLHIIALPKEPR